MSLYNTLIITWISFVLITIIYNWYLDSKYVKKRLSESINNQLRGEKPVIHYTNTLYKESIYDLYELVKKWIQENNGEIVSELKPAELEFIYPKGASVGGYRASLLDALNKNLIKVSLNTQDEQSVLLNIKFYPIEKVKFDSYQLDRKYLYFSLLEKMYKDIGYVIDSCILKKIYTIDVVKYRLEKRFRNMIIYCSSVIVGAVYLWNFDDAYASSLYVSDFIAVGKLLSLIFSFGIPYSIWQYLADRKFYQTLLQ